MTNESANHYREPTEDELQILLSLPFNLDSINRSMLKLGLIETVLPTAEKIQDRLIQISDPELLYQIHTESIGRGGNKNQRNFGGLVVVPLEIERDSYVFSSEFQDCKIIGVDWTPSGTGDPKPKFAISIAHVTVDDLKRLVNGVESEIADDAQVVCKTRPELAIWLIRRFGFEIDPDPKRMTTSSSSKKEDEPGSNKISLTIAFAKFKDKVKSLKPLDPDIIAFHRRNVIGAYAETYRKDEYPRHFL